MEEENFTYQHQKLDDKTQQEISQALSDKKKNYNCVKIFQENKKTIGEICHQKKKEPKQIASCKLKTTIIDELRLCYVAKSSLLKQLRCCKIAERIYFTDFYVIRVRSRYFHFTFYLCQDNQEQKQFATLNFDRIGNDTNNYVWYRPENWVLYDNNTLKYTLTIPQFFDLTFNNITALDLAKDFTMNITNLIKRYYRDKNITTIVNGKAIRNRKQSIPEFHMSFEVTLNRLKNPTFYAKQRKALHDKTKGICVSSYNKKAEIEGVSGKEYILDYYNRPKSLYRLEMHQNSNEIRNYCNSRHIIQCSDLIFNEEFLTDMFFCHLASVVRFTRGRQKLDWRDILSSDGAI